MRYRVAEMLAPEDFGASGTKTIDVNVKDVISRIDIIFRTFNGSSVFSDHPAANILNIELVDGSDVLFALSGRECQALNFYNRKMTPNNRLTGSNGEWMRANFGLDFGRKLFDPMLAFDPKKFVNPQLKITWDEDVANTSCEVNDLRIIAHIFDEHVPTPTGFLTSKELYSYTPVAGAYEHIDMPADRPLRNLMIGSHQEERAFTEMIAELRLSEDNDRKIPFDLTGDELFWYLKENYPEIIENVYHNIGTSATAFRVTPADDAVIVGSRTSTTGGLWIVFDNGGKARGLCVTSQETVYMHCKGYVPHGYAMLPFGDQDDPEDWYDITKIGSLRLRLKAGPSLGTTPTTQVVTQQVRKY